MSRLVRHALCITRHKSLVRVALAALGPVLGYRIAHGSGHEVPTELMQWHGPVIAWDWFAAPHTLDDLFFCMVRWRDW